MDSGRDPADIERTATVFVALDVVSPITENSIRALGTACTDISAHD